jgi:hypothetical protein
MRYGTRMSDGTDHTEQLVNTARMLWQSISMAAFLGSLLTALIFHGNLPEETAFVWTMGVFAGSLLLALPLLVLLALPFLAGVKALARKYDRYLFPSTVIGGVCGVFATVVLQLLIMAAAPGMKISGGTTDLVSFGGKLLMVSYAYGMSLALFIGLNQRPAGRRESHPPR